MAMASCSEEGEEVQKALQAVAQRLQWTYTLLWQLCPHQGALVWAEGHYNGAIKTRKTVQPAAPPPREPAAPEAADHAARHRSRQLRELFESLAREAAAAAGGGSRDHGVQEAAARRPSAALSPEDLTEAEWFYLMSASYSFLPGVGLPGRAFARRGHVWLTGANEVGSKTFSRAILAKSAGIQTVVCIPIVDGVLEIGTTEKVEEDIGFVQYARSILIDQHGIHMMPTISEHSTSNQITQIDQQSFQTERKPYTGQTKVESNNLNPEDENNEMEDYGIDTASASGSETNTEKDYFQHAPMSIMSNEQATPNAGTSSELMQLEMSEKARDGCSSNLDDEIQLLMACQNSNDQSSLQGQDEPWHFLYEDLCSGHPQSSAEDQAMISPENAHYSEAVLSILQHNARRQAGTIIKNYLAVSHQSPFSRWDPKGANNIQGMITEGTPQKMLKSVLFNFGSSHCNYREAQFADPRDGECAGALRRGDLISTNHVLKERRRREKLNERFIILRSLVPFVTKMDKASILGDTIEYVKQLRKRIQDLESRTRQTASEGNLTRQQPASTSQEKIVHNMRGSAAAASAEKRKLTRAVEGSSSGSSSSGRPAAPAAAAGAVHSTDVQVSIIESDALLELRCPYRKGVLLQIMEAIQELQLEITTVQASSADGVLLAELRAKVKEVNGRRSSISQVKRAIHVILSSG